MNTSQKKQTILLTGATGYIGRRLKHKLLEDNNNRIKLLVRHANSLSDSVHQHTEIIEGSTFDQDALKKALQDVDVAYYLIHSLHLGPGEFARADIAAAENFQRVAGQKKVQRIIYLGGAGNMLTSHSQHLRNRMMVTQVLQQGEVPVTTLQAAVIIGSGSASYEIIKNLVLNLPIMLIPSWTKNQCQPISIRDYVWLTAGRPCGGSERTTSWRSRLVAASTTSCRRRTRVAESGGQGRNRTTDTRIFSPLLYQLSYLATVFAA